MDTFSAFFETSAVLSSSLFEAARRSSMSHVAGEPSSLGKEGELSVIGIGLSEGLRGATDLKSDNRTRLLLVEDNFADVLLLTTLLEEQKFLGEVENVSDGEAALDYLFRRNQFSEVSSPDVILLDLNLPKKNGFEVLEAIANEPALKRIPIFILTSSRNGDDKLRAERHNIASFLLKPVELSGYETLVRKLISTEFPRVTGIYPEGGKSDGSSEHS